MHHYYDHLPTHRDTYVFVISQEERLNRSLYRLLHHIFQLSPSDTT